MENNIKPNLSQFLLFILLIIAGVALYILIFSKAPSENKPSEASSAANIKTIRYESQPAMTIDKNKKYTATFKTSKGDVVIELFVKETPIAVNNFVFLAREGFYDGTLFHRIVKGFMIQGGDPQGNGSGGPGYKFDDEKITRDYKRGILAMANSGPNTNGSQFFIMHKDYDLPKSYVIFGQVVKGLEVIDAIADVPTIDNGYKEQSKPTEKITIDKISITEK